MIWGHRINYFDLSKHDKKLIHEQYVKECLSKMTWMSIIVFFGEIILTILDMQSGFFEEHPVNHLNLLAEILLIISSLLFYIFSRYLRKHPDNPLIHTILGVDVYRLIIIVSVICFIFTDVYVRQKTLGAYMVFLFILQITPFYKAINNMLLYLFIGLFTTISYVTFTGMSANTIFSTLFIFLAFYFSANYLRVYYTNQLINTLRIEKSNKRFENLTLQTISALSSSVEAKDNYTNGHSQRVAEYSREIARRLGYTSEEQIEVYYIGLMHDIGKIGIPDTVINKNGKLTDEEYDEIKKHPIIGYEILIRITELPAISQGARWHHERYDGKGYPDGLAGDKIPIIARIIAVADAYDAMTSNRSYRKVLPQDVVRGEIEKNIGLQFAPEIARIMLQMIDEDTNYTMREL